MNFLVEPKALQKSFYILVLEKHVLQFSHNNILQHAGIHKLHVNIV